MTSSKRFAALPVRMEFAIALSAFSVLVFSSTQTPLFPCNFFFPPPVRPPALSTAFPRKQIPGSKTELKRQVRTNYSVDLIITFNHKAKLFTFWLGEPNLLDTWDRWH